MLFAGENQLFRVLTTFLVKNKNIQDLCSTGYKTDLQPVSKPMEREGGVIAVDSH